MLLLYGSVQIPFILCHRKDRGEAEGVQRTEEKEDRGCRAGQIPSPCLLFSPLSPPCPPSTRFTEPGSRLRGRLNTAAIQHRGLAARPRLQMGSRRFRPRSCFSGQKLCSWRGGTGRDWPTGCSCRRWLAGWTNWCWYHHRPFFFNPQTAWDITNISVMKVFWYSGNWGIYSEINTIWILICFVCQKSTWHLDGNQLQLSCSFYFHKEISFQKL